MNIWKYFIKISTSKLYYLIISFFYLIILVFQLYFSSYHDIISDKTFWLDFILFILVGILLRIFYFKTNDVKNEVIERLNIFYEEGRGISEHEIIDAGFQLDHIIREAFNPRNLLIFGFIGGFFVSLTVIHLNVLDDYPYLIFHFFFGFNHGMGLLICLKGYKFSKNVGKNYIKTIDIFDPDGMGGFRKLSKLFVDATIFTIIVLILDFLILSCTFTNESENFKLIVEICLLSAIIISISILFISFNTIRSTLVIHKKKKLEYIGKKYNEIESNFWESLLNKKDASSDALTLLTINEMYELIKNMKMWPLYETFSKVIPFILIVFYLIMEKVIAKLISYLPQIFAIFI